MKLSLRIVSLLSAVLLLWGAALPAFAEEEAPADTAPATAAPALPDGYSLPEGVSVKADGVLVMYLGADKNDDAVLCAQNADSAVGPAALIRMMVAAVALKEIEKQGLDIDTATGTYTVPLFNNFIAGTGLNVANMGFGETWTLRDLLTTCLITGAADAAVTLAAAVCGSVTGFVAEMNETAAEIGCTATSFANVTGDDAMGQYTTARDIYTFTRYAMSFPAFEALASNEQYTVHPTAGGKSRSFVTSNAMLRPSAPQYYEPVVFGRTGYTDLSGWSMVTLGRSGGYEYLVIVLGCKSGEQYTDTRTLYRWAFTNFTYAVLLAAGQPAATVNLNLAWEKDKLALVPAEELAAVVDSRLTEDGITKKFTIYAQTVDAPVTKGTVLGHVDLYVNVDRFVGGVDLVAAESVEASGVLRVWRVFLNLLRSGWLYLCLGTLLGAVGVIALIRSDSRRRRRHR